MKYKKAKPYFYLVPALILMVIFQFYPISKVLRMSFYVNYDYIREIVYERGLDNFQYLMADKSFSLAIRNTFVFAFIATPIGISVALIFALLLNEKIVGRRIFQSIYFLPFITSMVSVSVIFRWLLNKDFGLFNAFLKTMGKPPIAWITDPKMTIPILVVLCTYKSLGYKIIILLAALQNVKNKYISQARLDGAKKWQQTLYITLPTLKPTLIFLVITSLISSFKLFEEVYVLYDQKGGPMQSGLTMVFYIFDKFYRHWEFSLASAAAFVLFVILFVFTLIQFSVFRKLEEKQ